MTFLVVGESLVDVVLRPDGSRLVRPGGSAANVAVALGRQGNDVTLLTALGEDAHGELLRSHLAQSHVRLCAAPLPRTSVAHASLDEAGEPSYSFDLAWDLGGLAPPARDGWLHVGSLGAVLEPGASRVRELVAGHRGPVSLDPNCRPTLMGPADRVLPQVEALVAQADLVKLSAQDAAWLCPGTAPGELARRWLALGPAAVVVTLGGEGALACCAEGDVLVPAAPGGPVSDTVGAGDAFAAGLLASLTDLGDPVRSGRLAVGTGRLRQALEHAAQLARRTCERPGADPPWRGAAA